MLRTQHAPRTIALRDRFSAETAVANGLKKAIFKASKSKY